MRLVWICLKGFFKKTKIVEKKFLSVSQGYMIYNVQVHCMLKGRKYQVFLYFSTCLQNVHGCIWRRKCAHITLCMFYILCILHMYIIVGKNEHWISTSSWFLINFPNTILNLSNTGTCSSFEFWKLAIKVILHIIPLT